MALDIIPKQEGGKLKAVASGTLPSGKPVIVNSDGTVSVVGESTVSQALGTPVEHQSTGVENTTIVYSGIENKFVTFFRDGTNSNKGTARVITVDPSDNSITYGAKVVYNNAYSEPASGCLDVVSGNVVHSFKDLNGDGQVVVGTVSGASITFGSPVAINTSSPDALCARYDPTNEKVVFCYRTSDAYGRARVGTVSGTSISFGTEVIFASATTDLRFFAMTYDASADKMVIVFKDVANSNYGKAIVASVSGTTLSFGSETTFESAKSEQIAVAYDPSSEKNLIAYYYNDTNGRAVVGTVSGTSISFGSITSFDSGKTFKISIVGSTLAGKVTLAYEDDTDSEKGKIIVGTISGTDPTFGSEVVFDTNAINETSMDIDTASGKIVVGYNEKSSGDGRSVVFQPEQLESNLTSENYIGMSGGAVDVDSQTEDIGSSVVFNNTGNTTKPHLCFDTNSNKVVIGFIDNAVSEKGTAIVGTVSGTSISFGSETVYEQSVTDFPAMVYDSSNNKVIVAYQDEGNTDYGTVAVGTVSGTSISFGTPVVFESAAVQHVALAFDSNSNKVVVSYSDHGNSEYGTAIVGTVSGTSISFGSASVFQSAQTARVSSTFDSSSNKVVIAYRTSTGQAVVGTVSGTTISFGTPVEFYNALTDELDIAFDSNVNKVVIGYLSSASDAGLAKVGTVSGTSISFGAEATFESANVASISPVFDSSINKVVLVYSDVGNSRYGTYAVGTINSTDITFETPSVFASVDTRSQVGAVFDTNSNKVAIAYRDDSNSSYGTSVVMVPGYQDIVRGSVADGDNATVDIVGTVSSNQVSLTAGQQYYVQTDGTIGTTPADPSVLAGTAVSATKLLVKT